jgi:imidazole glycerol-phosphate synthase subunit HisH
VKIVVIDYGTSNLHSAAKALERAAADVAPGSTVCVSADPAEVARADRIVLPGVGAFADCRRGLQDVPGMVEALTRTVCEGGRPFLGTCVGMQLMASVGREHGDHQGLGWIAGEVVPIASAPGLKIPHMGWNDLECLRPGHPLFIGIAAGSDVYFVHSYHFRPVDAADRLALVDYGGPLVAAVARANLAGVQFHPEKSQAVGLAFLANFLRWRP